MHFGFLKTNNVGVELFNHGFNLVWAARTPLILNETMRMGFLS